MNKRIINLENLKWIVLIFVFLATTTCSPNNKTNYSGYYPSKSWKQVENLEAAGWSLAKLETAREFANTLNMAAMVVLHKGKMLQSWGDVERKIPQHSVRKSLLIELYGPWVQKGVINLSATMEDLGIDDIPPKLTEEEKQATVRMLMQARSGVYHSAAFATDAMEASRPERHSHAPGTFWHYNNWDFNVIGHIYRQQTGKDIFKSFEKIIANPIGMKDFNLKTDGRYVYDRGESKYPAYPFKMSTLNLARFGLLMAREGRWKNKQIIPQFWVKQSTVTYSKTGSQGGYGYMWWTSLNGESNFEGVSLPHGLFSARGYRGHVITVIPDKDIVYVYNNDDSNDGKSTSYSDIGKLLEMILDAKMD